MCLLWRSPMTRSPESTSGDFIFNLVIADSGKLEIGTRQVDNWRVREPPDFLPFCQPGALSTRPYCSWMPRHHSRLPGRYKTLQRKLRHGRRVFLPTRSFRKKKKLKIKLKRYFYLNKLQASFFVNEHFHELQHFLKFVGYLIKSKNF